MLKEIRDFVWLCELLLSAVILYTQTKFILPTTGGAITLSRTTCTKQHWGKLDILKLTYTGEESSSQEKRFFQQQQKKIKRNRIKIGMCTSPAFNFRWVTANLICEQFVQNASIVLQRRIEQVYSTNRKRCTGWSSKNSFNTFLKGNGEKKRSGEEKKSTRFGWYLGNKTSEPVVNGT